MNLIKNSTNYCYKHEKKSYKHEKTCFFVFIAVLLWSNKHEYAYHYKK